MIQYICLGIYLVVMIALEIYAFFDEDSEGPYFWLGIIWPALLLIVLVVGPGILVTDYFPKWRRGVLDRRKEAKRRKAAGPKASGEPEPKKEPVSTPKPTGYREMNCPGCGKPTEE